jgi:altronate dehydratase large subunit
MEKKFYGYPREDGSVGIRNHVLIVPVQRVLNALASQISSLVSGTEAIITTGESGRPKPDREVVRRTLIGLAANPNTAAVLLLGPNRSSGYKELTAEGLYQAIQGTGKRIEMLLVEDEGGFYESLGKGVRLARELSQWASRILREPFDPSRLCIAVKCGMSDATSGIAGNIVVGNLFDRVISGGGAGIFSETTEVIGAEHILVKRAENEAVADALLQAVKATEDKARSTGEDIRSINPIPENIAGGISTLEEKSLGAILKAGNSPLKGVIEYAQRIPGKGLYFMDAWMSSLSLPTGFGAAGANLMIYQMGGSGLTGFYPPMPAYNSGVVIPILYMTGNSDTFVRAQDNIDFNAGTVLEKKEDWRDAGERLLDLVLSIASGAKTKVETFKYRDPVELYLQGPVL